LAQACQSANFDALREWAEHVQVVQEAGAATLMRQIANSTIIETSLTAIIAMWFFT
jgi:hypothetical protein